MVKIGFVYLMVMHVLNLSAACLYNHLMKTSRASACVSFFITLTFMSCSDPKSNFQFTQLSAESVGMLGYDFTGLNYDVAGIQYLDTATLIFDDKEQLTSRLSKKSPEVTSGDF